MSWPVDILVQFLGWLARDGASVAFQHLAYLTINSSELQEAARKMRRPLVLDVHIDDSTENQFRIPIDDAQVVNIKIDWGDGSEERVSLSQMSEEALERERRGEFDFKFYMLGPHRALHKYADTGDYVIRIFPGDSIGPVWLDHLGFGMVDGDEVKNPFGVLHVHKWWPPLRAVRSLGALGIRSLSGWFREAKEFNLPLSHLDMSNITDLSFMFAQAESFNQPIEKWNVSNVTNMRATFSYASSFNQPLDGWEVGNVEDMSYMFHGAKSFNQPVGDWDVGQVESMQCMFQNAASFDRPLRDWDVSSVREMAALFDGATLFNQPLDTWNVSEVSNTRRMFFNAESFNQDLSSWDVSNAEADGMFEGATNFDLQSISGWKYQPGTTKRASRLYLSISGWEGHPDMDYSSSSSDS
jgi:surface protein